MAHVNLDPITYFINSQGYFPTKTQQNIINTMDSCQFTIIQQKRCYGITTALRSYAEWEFLYSEKPIEITYAGNNRYGIEHAFPHLEHFKKDRYTYRSNINVIETKTTEELFRMENMRGSVPSDVYIIDDGLYGNNDDYKLYELMNLCNSRIGQRVNTAYASAYSMESDCSPIQTIRTYEGSRFVIVTVDAQPLVDRLIYSGINEDLIGPVDMSGEPLDLFKNGKYYANMIAQDLIGVQPMTKNTGQIFKINYSPTFGLYNLTAAP